MTRDELKAIINECLVEEGIVINEEFDEEQAIIENCEFIEEACFEALKEYDDIVDCVSYTITDIDDEYKIIKFVKDNKNDYAKQFAGSKTLDEAKSKISKAIAEKLGKWFKATKDGKVVSSYNKKDGNAKKFIAIAAAATALVATISAIVMKNKKNKDKEAEKEDK